MEMERQFRSTGISKIDTAVREFLKKPMRDTTIVRKFNEDFPGQVVKTNKRLEVSVVGAGWLFPRCATALIAAGAARIVAYEMNMEKLGMGQMGLTSTGLDFDYYRADTEAQLMPEFTAAQLDKLPSGLRDIAEDPSYRALMEKRARIRSMGKAAYEKLPSSDKISKREVIETKRRVLELMQATGVLRIVHQEVTIDMMTTWLRANKPVFMMSGKQFKLERQGFNHLVRTPGFVKEYLTGNEETENLIQKLSENQRRLQSQTQVLGAPDLSKLSIPSVAIIGGGATGLSCALDLLQRVQPELLRVVYINPKAKLRMPHAVITAQQTMSYRFIPGYVSGLALLEDEKTVDSVKIVGFPEREVREIHTSLFIHTHNECMPRGKWRSECCCARDTITKLLDEKLPINGLVRDHHLLPREVARDIQFRITESWEASLNDDSILIRRIKDIIHQQDHRQVAIIVNGNNPMIWRVTWLAAELGYRGQFLQVALPDREEELEEALEEINHTRHDVKGRLVKHGTSFKNGKFTLGVQDSKGNFVRDVPDVDAVINAVGKTSRTPLIERMIEMKYLYEKDGNLYSSHDTLSGHHSVFQADYPQFEVNSPSVTVVPFHNPRYIEPNGWEPIFKYAISMSVIYS
jgi:hypothetical protein